MQFHNTGQSMKVILSLGIFLLLSTFTTQTLAELEASVVYVTRDLEQAPPLSLIDKPIEKDGLAGAMLGMDDNRTTGKFLNHKYQLQEIFADAEADLTDSINSATTNPPELIVANLQADDLLTLSGSFPDALILNARAEDNRLRNNDCRANLLHIAPSRAMLTDALAQYLAWKRWDRVVIVTGRHAEDSLYAESLNRATKRFGLKVVGRKDWDVIPGARRTDSGHHNAQQEIPAFTEFKEYDALLVADERDEFGEYLPYRTRTARLVAGTQGLMPAAWHRAHEQWGATQIQRRFEEKALRSMSKLDYQSWLAVRAIGEAITVTGSTEVGQIREHLLSEKFKLAGFKGRPLTFRSFNGQLRQPVLLVAPRMLVSVSPQAGFLHQVTELDTLGFDAPETSCESFAATQK